MLHAVARVAERARAPGPGRASIPGWAAASAPASAAWSASQRAGRAAPEVALACTEGPVFDARVWSGRERAAWRSELARPLRSRTRCSPPRARSATASSTRASLDLSTLGGIVSKGLYLEPRDGCDVPRIVETPSGLLNAIGLQGVGVRAFVRDVLPRLARLRHRGRGERLRRHGRGVRGGHAHPGGRAAAWTRSRSTSPART